MSILSARHLKRSFGSGASAVRAVDDVSLDVKTGELVLIMGPSGSGKTTLLSMLGGLLRPSSGSILLGGVDLCQLREAELPAIRARQIGFVFQAFNLLDALSVEQNVLLPAQLAPGGVRAARERARALLEQLDLGARRDARPRTLSGGEKQRVAIARALINQPPLILADEPTGNLDSQKGAEVTMLLHDVARERGCSVVVVTHDPRIEDVADRILWLEDGQLRDRKSEAHAWARDPVCGMRVDAWTANFSSELDGHAYWFCSVNCKRRFDADPWSHLGARSTSEERKVLGAG